MEICNSLNLSCNSNVDMNSEYDEVINFFFTNGLKMCELKYYYQILLLYPMDESNTALQVVQGICNLHGILKNQFSYLCSCLVQYDTMVYCAVYMDWGSLGYKRKHTFHYELNINDEIITPIMISIEDKGISILRKLFKSINQKIYINNWSGDAATTLHEDERDIQLNISGVPLSDL